MTVRDINLADSEPVAATPRRLIFSLALGTAGGALFNFLSLPLPWMLGAMAATAIAAVGGQPIAMSRYERPATTGSALTALSPADVALLIGCGIAGLWIGNRFSLPAGSLAGPLAFSAAIHLAGLTASSPPGVLVAAAQVVLGTSVGARFAGLTFSTTKRTIILSAVITAVMLLLSGAIAFVVGPAIGVNPMALLLALSPGGVTEMSLMALALNQDIAFVTTHHVVRIALIVMIGPAVFALLTRYLRKRVDLPTPTKTQE